MITPALSAWRQEVAAGQRDPRTIDPLWRAACAEANAVELEAVAPGIAESERRRAAEIIRAAWNARANLQDYSHPPEIDYDRLGRGSAPIPIID